MSIASVRSVFSRGGVLIAGHQAKDIVKRVAAAVTDQTKRPQSRLVCLVCSVSLISLMSLMLLMGEGY